MAQQKSRQEESCEHLSLVFPEFENLYQSSRHIWKNGSRSSFLYHLLDVHQRCTSCFHDERGTDSSYRILQRMVSDQTMANSPKSQYSPPVSSTFRYQHDTLQRHDSAENILKGVGHGSTNRNQNGDYANIPSKGEAESHVLVNEVCGHRASKSKKHMQEKGSNKQIRPLIDQSHTSHLKTSRTGVVTVDSSVHDEEEKNPIELCNKTAASQPQIKAECHEEGTDILDTGGTQSVAVSDGIQRHTFGVEKNFLRQIEAICSNDQIQEKLLLSEENNENSTIVHSNENWKMTDDTPAGDSEEEYEKIIQENSDITWYQVQIFRLDSRRGQKLGRNKNCPTECLQCQQDFLSQDGLRKHLKDHSIHVPSLHLKFGQKNKWLQVNFCNLCKVYFRYPRPHIPNCVDPEPYKCTICEKRGFKSRGALHHHNRHCHEEKRFLCDTCGKLFPRAQELRLHKAFHANLRSELCTICGATFNTNKLLQRHLRIHNEEEYKSCEYCDRKFTQYGNLKRHMRMHTGEKPYQCDLCSATFTHNVSLKTHKKSKHGIDWWAIRGLVNKKRK